MAEYTTTHEGVMEEVLKILEDALVIVEDDDSLFLERFSGAERDERTKSMQWDHAFKNATDYQKQMLLVRCSDCDGRLAGSVALTVSAMDDAEQTGISLAVFVDEFRRQVGEKRAKRERKEAARQELEKLLQSQNPLMRMFLESMPPEMALELLKSRQSSSDSSHGKGDKSGRVQ